MFASRLVRNISPGASRLGAGRRAAHASAASKWAFASFLVASWLTAALVAAGEAPPGMAAIPGGIFMMGCSPGDYGCFREEGPAREVAVKSFWMDATVVTQAEFRAAMGENPSRFSGCPDCPVERVTWAEARTYCAKVGKRLPTEAEWEFAARGGTNGPRYGGLDEIAWYESNSAGRTHPVGRKQPNAYGLYDMLGNVEQWCADWHGDEYFAPSSANDPEGWSSSAKPMLRGGSWSNGPWGVRGSARFRVAAEARLDTVGFRCARDGVGDDAATPPSASPGEAMISTAFRARETKTPLPDEAAATGGSPGYLECAVPEKSAPQVTANGFAISQ
jgi:formylglycine-generating enzyme required for sulfatase activity